MGRTKVGLELLTLPTEMWTDLRQYTNIEVH